MKTVKRPVAVVEVREKNGMSRQSTLEDFRSVVPLSIKL